MGHAAVCAAALRRRLAAVATDRPADAPAAAGSARPDRSGAGVGLAAADLAVEVATGLGLLHPLAPPRPGGGSSPRTQGVPERAAERHGSAGRELRGAAAQRPGPLAGGAGTGVAAQCPGAAVRRRICGGTAVSRLAAGGAEAPNRNGASDRPAGGPVRPGASLAELASGPGAGDAAGAGAAGVGVGAAAPGRWRSALGCDRFARRPGGGLVRADGRAAAGLGCGAGLAGGARRRQPQPDRRPAGLAGPGGPAVAGKSRQGVSYRARGLNAGPEGCDSGANGSDSV